MRKHGIDIDSYTSKTLDQFLEQPWDYVITVCDDANETCPIFPGAKHRLHWSFPDPSANMGSDRQAAFDRAVTAIQERLCRWLESGE